MGQRCLDDPERRVNVGLHRRVEILRRNVENGAARLLPSSVADDDIEAAETLDSASNQFLTEFLVPDIAGYRESGAAFSLDQRNHFLRVGLFRWKIVDGDVGALARIGNRRGA